MEYAEVARAESERGELVLRERRDPRTRPSTLELRVNGVFVMDTRRDQQRAGAGPRRAELGRRPARVLVGGLGLGFTMHEVLADRRVERCTVVEIEEALVDWLRDGTVPHGPRLLADERVNVVVADVAGRVAEAGPAAFDLVLLDVDNGPDFLVHDDNAALYERAVPRAARAALRRAARWWSGRRRGAELAGRRARGLRRRRGAAYDVELQAADEYVLALRRAGTVRMPDRRATSPASSTTAWARSRCPTTRCGGRRPSAPWRTSRSAAPRSSRACPCARRSSRPRRPRQRRLGVLAGRAGRRDRAPPPARSPTGPHDDASRSTSSRPGRAPAPT